MSAEAKCPQCGSDLPADAPASLCPRCLLQAGLASAATGAEPAAGAPPAAAPHAEFTPPTPAELAAKFPQLEVLELLGHGGMGAVYKARQIKLDRLVALKIVRPAAAGDAAFAERFLREARLLARLNHPNVVSIFDFGEADGLYFFVMEFVDGACLRQLMQAGGLTPGEALAVIPQVCEALQYAHDAGIVHRDVKPENILLDRQGRVKIADFGLAKLAGGSGDPFTLTGTHQVMGTPRYMAPEQIEGSHQVDHRADIYSLGVVFYELLTGELPLGQFQPPSKKVTVDVRLDEVVLRSLAKEPDRRYQHASEIKDDVQSISAAPAAPPVRPAPTRRSGEPISEALRRQVRWPALAVLATGLAAVFPTMIALVHFVESLNGTAGASAVAIAGLFVLTVLGLYACVTIVRGAWHMLSLEEYKAALLASILTPPAGIWGMLVLSRPEVRAAFAKRDAGLPIAPFAKVLSNTLIWSAAAATVGIVAAFMPWCEPEGLLYGASNSLFRALVRKPGSSAGIEWTHGTAACFAMAGVLLVLISTAAIKPVPVGRPWAVVAACVIAIGATIAFMGDEKDGSLSVRPLLDVVYDGNPNPPRGLVQVEIRQLATVADAKMVTRLLAGPKVELGAALALLLLAAVDLRTVYLARAAKYWSGK